MKQFEIPNLSVLLDKADAIVKEGVGYGIDQMKPLLQKIESVRQAVKDGIVRIVLVGSFSDGKTSAIAGLLGRLENSMKIDTAESSDELTVYRPEGLKKGFEIVDTPGLFGTKEKEIEGEDVKFSDITRRYISEAHIVVYVCDAHNPLKDSHVPVIREILRDLGKLDSTIFVINKMDGQYDTNDEEDFQEGVRIKTQNLIDRLRSTINLTPAEERRLHIVCIAANPKNKGLDFWFGNGEEYRRRSHIGSFRKALTEVVNNSDVGQLRNKTALVSIRKAMTDTSQAIDCNMRELARSRQKADDATKNMDVEAQIMHGELEYSWKSLAEEVDAYRGEIIAEVGGASLDTFSNVLETQIGVGEGGKLSFSAFERKLEQIVSGAADSVAGIINSHAVVFEQGFKDQENFIKSSIKNGAEYMKGVKITREQILAIRDALFKSLKFKPWGATNLANKINKGINVAMVAVQVGLEAWNIWQQWKANKKMEEAKRQIIDVLRASFANLDGLFRKEDDYFANFAPQYQKLVGALQESKLQVEEMKQRLIALEAYSQKVKAFIEAEDAEYTEV